VPLNCGGGLGLQVNFVEIQGHRVRPVQTAPRLEVLRGVAELAPSILCQSNQTHPPLDVSDADDQGAVVRPRPTNPPPPPPPFVRGDWHRPWRPPPPSSPPSPGAPPLGARAVLQASTIGGIAIGEDLDASLHAVKIAEDIAQDNYVAGGPPSPPLRAWQLRLRPSPSAWHSRAGASSAVTSESSLRAELTLELAEACVLIGAFCALYVRGRERLWALCASVHVQRKVGAVAAVPRHRQQRVPTTEPAEVDEA